MTTPADPGHQRMPGLSWSLVPPGCLAAWSRPGYSLPGVTPSA